MTFSRRTPLYHKAIQLVHANVNIAMKPPLAMIADDMSPFQYGQTIGFNFKLFIVDGICRHIGPHNNYMCNFAELCVCVWCGLWVTRVGSVLLNMRHRSLIPPCGVHSLIANPVVFPLRVHVSTPAVHPLQTKPHLPAILKPTRWWV
jgi:hypothetical protein